MTETPDEWLLTDYDRRSDQPSRDPSITNHVRPMFEVLADVPCRGDGTPVMSGSARWPEPHLHHDLDELDQVAEYRAQRIAEYRAAQGDNAA